MEKAERDVLTEALREYGQAVKDGGWDAGEPIIARNAGIHDFAKWAMAMRLMIRADELLQESRR